MELYNPTPSFNAKINSRGQIDYYVFNGQPTSPLPSSNLLPPTLPSQPLLAHAFKTHSKENPLAEQVHHEELFVSQSIFAEDLSSSSSSSITSPSSTVSSPESPSFMEQRFVSSDEIHSPSDFLPMTFAEQTFEEYEDEDEDEEFEEEEDRSEQKKKEEEGQEKKKKTPQKKRTKKDKDERSKPGRKPKVLEGDELKKFNEEKKARNKIAVIKCRKSQKIAHEEMMIQYVQNEVLLNKANDEIKELRKLLAAAQSKLKVYEGKK
jgi:hypothetical protein